MLELKLLELFGRGIPEGLLFMLAAYVFTKTTINTKRVVLSGVMYAVGVYLIRLLPIQYGINTLLTIVIIMALNTSVNKIDTIKSTQATILIMITGFVSEVVSVVILENIFRVDIDKVFSQPKLKVLYGAPSLLVIALIVGCWYMMEARKKTEKKSRKV